MPNEVPSAVTRIVVAWPDWNSASEYSISARTAIPVMSGEEAAGATLMGASLEPASTRWPFDARRSRGLASERELADAPGEPLPDTAPVVELRLHTVAVFLATLGIVDRIRRVVDDAIKAQFGVAVFVDPA